MVIVCHVWLITHSEYSDASNDENESSDSDSQYDPSSDWTSVGIFLRIDEIILGDPLFNRDHIILIVSIRGTIAR